MINDCHIHLGVSPSVNRSISTIDIAKLRKQNKVDKMLVFGTEYDVKTNNQMVKYVADNVPYVYGLYWISDDNSDLILNNKMIGCKYHGSYNNEYAPPVEIMEQLDKKNAVLMMHTGRFMDGSCMSKTSYLHAFEVGRCYSNIKLIMAHMGGTDTNICKKAIEKSRDYDNIYFDTSGVTTPFIIEYAVDNIPSDRILFGSDAPWCSFNAMLYTILDARIPETGKADILYRNFERLIKSCEWLQTT